MRLIANRYQTFMQHHADLLSADYWNLHKQRIQAGAMLACSPTSRSAAS